MPRRWLPYNRMNRSEKSSLHKLLGELEIEVMERMWQLEQGGAATVRDVASALEQQRGTKSTQRPIAYTTVMTVMSHLADKGLLYRVPFDKKTYLYKVALTREEFLERASQQLVDAMVADFGDLALAQFVEAVEHLDPERIERLLEHVERIRTARTPAVPPGQGSPTDSVTGTEGEGSG